MIGENSMKSIKVMTDYNCMPLWHYGSGDVGEIDPSTLPISKDLISGFMAWADDYNATLNHQSPQDSGFKSKDVELAFIDRGLVLAQELKNELKDFNVYYFHEGMGREVLI